jgi:drug/metabolite transporter (DMT)-like permease
MVGYAATLGAVLIWALSYIVMKSATTDYPQLLFQFWRYAVVAAIYTLLFYRSVRTIPASLWKKGFGWLGLSIFAVSIFSIYAVQYTTPTRVVVINSLIIAVVPLLRWMHGRSKPTRPELAAIGIAMLAILLLLGPQESDVQLGDGLAFLGMIGYAYMIVLVDRMLTKDNATVVQVSYLGIVGCAFYFVAAAAVYAAVRPEGLAVQALLNQPSTIGGIVFMILFVSLAANLLQVVGQRRLTPVTVSILFCLEPAVTGVLDYFLLGNSPSFRLVLSGLLLIAATVVASVRFRKEQANVGGLPAQVGRSDASIGQ